MKIILFSLALLSLISHADQEPVSEAVLKAKEMFALNRDTIGEIVELMINNKEIVQLKVSGICLTHPEGSYGPFRNCNDVDPNLIRKIGDFVPLLKKANVLTVGSEFVGKEHQVKFAVESSKSDYGFYHIGYRYQSKRPRKGSFCPSKIPTSNAVPKCFIKLDGDYYITVGWLPKGQFDSVIKLETQISDKKPSN